MLSATQIGFLCSLLTPEQHIAFSNYMLSGDGGTSAIATPQKTAGRTSARSTRRIGRTTATKTRAPRSGSATSEVMNYLGQHPTAAFTAAQLREVSPFKTWTGKKANNLTQALSRLAKSGKVIRVGDGWQISKIVPAAQVEWKRQARTRRTARASVGTRRTGTDG